MSDFIFKSLLTYNKNISKRNGAEESKARQNGMNVLCSSAVKSKEKIFTSTDKPREVRECKLYH